VQEARDAALARSVDHDLGATAIDGMEVVLARHPHARQAGEVEDLVDILEGVIHDGRIEHRTVDILRPCGTSTHRRAKIENAHTAISCEERDEMLSDEAAAARDERLPQGCWPTEP
jgi:hypothetical protein